MNKILLVLTIVLLTGCMKDEQTSETVGNGFQVEFLFEKDGVKVYRFFDGRYHYFTTLGETMTKQHSGKSNYEENIKSLSSSKWE
jgi:hypothetical protein